MYNLQTSQENAVRVPEPKISHVRKLYAGITWSIVLHLTINFVVGALLATIPDFSVIVIIITSLLFLVHASVVGACHIFPGLAAKYFNSPNSFILCVICDSIVLGYLCNVTELFQLFIVIFFMEWNVAALNFCTTIELTFFKSILVSTLTSVLLLGLLLGFSSIPPYQLWILLVVAIILANLIVNSAVWHSDMEDDLFYLAIMQTYNGIPSLIPLVLTWRNWKRETLSS